MIQRLKKLIRYFKLKTHEPDILESDSEENARFPARSADKAKYEEENLVSQRQSALLYPPKWPPV